VSGSGTHAVVAGAGIAGLCAAQVLADCYDRVTLIDRDALPPTADARAGAPQGRHVHAVLVRGNEAIRDLFPGLVAELAADGVPTGDLLAHARSYHSAHRLAPAPSGLEGIYISRPHLEHRLRARLVRRPNVTVTTEHTVTGLTTTQDQSTITGVRTKSAGDDQEHSVGADLVVDATGRTSRLPQWLTAIGYAAPPEQRLRIDVTYSSCAFAMPDDVIDHDHGVLIAPTPGNPRGGGLIDMGAEGWLVSLTGYRDTPPPVTPEGFLEFARRLAAPDIHQALLRATPIGTPARYRMPEAVRRRYERLTRFPDRLVVLGDATSSFNPIYAQGMSVAAQQALLLRRHLRAGGPRRTAALRAGIAQAGAAAWTMSVNYDLRLPWINGRRTPAVRLGNAYLALLHRVAPHDARVAEAFMRVANLIDPPARIARPAIAGRVFAGTLRPRRQPAGKR
jgi:2-polyprenyl-6-methoxyphenol hydroxylase-like FAD-dependent oxidoreductase